MRRADATTLAGLAIILALVLVALLDRARRPVCHRPGTRAPPADARASLRHRVFGEDVFSRVLWGARFDLLIAAVAVGIALVLGGALGAVAGFTGGWADEGLMRAMDVLQAFPTSSSPSASPPRSARACRT